jgi:ribonuclease P protein component
VKREQRLRSAADLRRAREAAPRAWSHPLLVLYVASNDLSPPGIRVGVTVSRRVGKAVVRNRVRRRIREAVRRLLPRVRARRDLLFIARPASATAEWADLRQAIERLLAQAGLIEDAPATAVAHV